MPSLITFLPEFASYRWVDNRAHSAFYVVANTQQPPAGHPHTRARGQLSP